MRSKTFLVLFAIVLVGFVLSACGSATEAQGDLVPAEHRIGANAPKIKFNAEAASLTVCRVFEQKLDTYGKEFGPSFESDSLISECQEYVRAWLDQNGSYPKGEKIVLGGISETHEAATIIFKQLMETDVLKDFGSYSQGHIVEMLKASFAYARGN